MTPANERKAAERKRKREAGLVPLEVWVKAEHAAAVREYVEGLNNGTIVYVQPYAGTFDQGTISVVLG